MKNEHIVKIKSIEQITHDVLQMATNRPDNYDFKSGQATDVSINAKDWCDEKQPFTFTSLPDDDYLQFTIITYPDHGGVTNELLELKPGDELILHSVFGATHYTKPSVFIAGGAGVTQFISILRNLQSKDKIGQNKLIFANKTKSGIINQQFYVCGPPPMMDSVLENLNKLGVKEGVITTEEF
ncbi:hypothetical protein MASR2M47_02750 [Draconibacterium sp.]